MSGEHGRSLKEADFALSPADLQEATPNMKYARAAMLVAQKAPLRILPGEWIVGSATMLDGPRHMTPLAGVPSTSHTTLGFHKVLECGYSGLRRQIAERLARGDLQKEVGAPQSRSATSISPGEDLLQSMLLCLEAAEAWHRRHMEQLDELAAAATGPERDGYRRAREALRDVPESRPQTFHQAVQSLWFTYAFQRLMGNWSGIGRIDQMLGPYLQRDLEHGRLTLDEAREILAHFWIKGCEWTGAPDVFGGTGDAQFYQNVILSGVDADGRDITNEVTYLVLDIVEELHISDFPIAVRINPQTPERLLRRVAEVQRHGGGTVGVYNENVVIDGLVKLGYPLAEARTFTNDGCWEALIPGRTTFSYVPFDMLGLLQATLGLNGSGDPPAYPDFEHLYGAFLAHLDRHLESHHRQADGWARNGVPAPLVSLFVEDCIERARGYHDRGSRYSVLAPHAGGMANVANSLLVIRKLVFEEKYIGLTDFVRILRDDWKGHEHLRRLVLNRFRFYGNDDPAADAMMRRVFDDYTRLAARTREREGVLRPAGISTFGREIGWSRPAGHRLATADGHREGEYLATNCSPSPGTDQQGPTAVIRSYCGLDFTRAPNGATVELKIHPDSVKDEAGLTALVALMRGFVRLGGWFMHVDVVDSAMLVDAQRHPEKYPNLAVRVAGWSARFATLDRQWQDMVINRTQQVC
ncbi:MAG TPA: pyruvate formate lyase family protein [Phycisphaerae bacterium]|nr:pyruvate formate lyase family protein [Phycisphaerae bacterium]HSA27073.1 pyruvate formate lyase family protein [Phycisphaerae bacterium]